MALTKDQKKARRQEKAKAAQEAIDSDSGPEDFDEDGFDAEVETAASRRKKHRGKAAFLKLVRQGLAILALGFVLGQQPFMLKPRVPGVNRGKLVPLQLAVVGAVHWAAESPTTLRKPYLKGYLNETARVLLTPAEYLKAQNSKRAMPNEKTWKAAYKKAKKALGRVADGDAFLLEMLRQPQPNLPLIGSYLLTAGAILTPLINGAEYAIVIGAGAVLHGCRSLGMEPQPELYVTGAFALFAGIVWDMAKAKPPAAIAKQPRARRK